jgi:hypothetical protein
MKDIAVLIQALSSLLWPILAFLIVLVFRLEIRDVMVRLARMKRGKFFGQEIEIEVSEVLAQDDSSKILNAYLFPNGAYSLERLQTLNALLRELGVVRDVRLILDGAEGAALRKQLIKYAKEKGYAVDAPTANQATG